VGKFRLRVFFALVGFACVLIWPGCSGNGALTITLTPSTTPTIDQGKTQPITAVVANDKNKAGVTWSLSGDGSLTDITTTSVTYQAPASLPSSTSVTVTATSVTTTTVTAVLTITVNSVLSIVTTSLPVGELNVPYFGVISAGGSAGPFTWVLKSGTLPAGLSLPPSTTDSIVISGTPTALGSSSFTMQVSDSTGTVATQALIITINPPPPLSVGTRSLPPGTVGVNYPSQTLQPASGTPPYTWAITLGSLPAGLTMNSAGVISGVPTVAGTSNFTVQVTDSTTPAPQVASAQLSIVINPSTANNANLDGNYAFLVSGFSPNGHFVAAGSFLADGAGHISGGVMDTNDPAGLQLAQGFTGSYALGSNNLGTMLLGTRSFALAVSVSGNAKIIEFDDVAGNGTRNSGVLLKQSTSAFSQSEISGNYAFGFSGTDAAAARYALAGAMHADGTGVFTSGQLDSNDAGVAQSVAFTGTYAGISPATGRGTATISIAGQGTTNYSFYVVSATQLLVMEIDQVLGQGSAIVSGSILQQSGPFDLSKLSGNGVLQTTALDTSGPVRQSQVGLFNGDGGGNFTLNTSENTGGTSSVPSCSGTYGTPDSTTGRTTLTYSGTACAESTLYLVSTNQAFVMGTDANVTFGSMEAQTGQLTLSGAYAGGSIAPVLSSAGTQVDIAVTDGVNGLDFTTDSSTSGGLLQNQMANDTYSLSNGVGTITQSGTIFYMVSPTEFISLLTDADATIEVFEQ
jgi:hypothetical protein